MFSVEAAPTFRKPSVEQFFFWCYPNEEIQSLHDPIVLDSCLQEAKEVFENKSALSEGLTRLQWMALIRTANRERE